jgi:hypothetical protein
MEGQIDGRLALLGMVPAVIVSLCKLGETSALEQLHEIQGSSSKFSTSVLMM